MTKKQKQKTNTYLQSQQAKEMVAIEQERGERHLESKGIVGQTSK